VSFGVDGLVLNAGNASGTKGQIKRNGHPRVANRGLCTVRTFLNIQEVTPTAKGDADFQERFYGITGKLRKHAVLVGSD